MYLNKLYRDGITRFPDSASLHISFAFFLLEYMGSKHLALEELRYAETTHPLLDEEFITYRYKRMIEDEMVEGINEDGTLDVVSIMAYE